MSERHAQALADAMDRCFNAWQRSQPQTFIDFQDLAAPEPPPGGGETTSARGTIGRGDMGGTPRPPRPRPSLSGEGRPRADTPTDKEAAVHTLPLRAHVRRYPCAVCGRHKTADRLIYSRWTRNRYCADLAECRRVADKRRHTDPRDAA